MGILERETMAGAGVLDENEDEKPGDGEADASEEESGGDGFHIPDPVYEFDSRECRAPEERTEEDDAEDAGVGRWREQGERSTFNAQLSMWNGEGLGRFFCERS